MTRWFSVLQLRNESDGEGRFERVVGGPHKGVDGWLFFTVKYALIVILICTAIVLIVNGLIY